MAEPDETIRDFVTGKELPYCDDEYVRQSIERFLVEELGYPAEWLDVDHRFTIEVDGEKHPAGLDLLIQADNRPFMAFRCMRGSLVTREREALAGSRLADSTPIPYTVVTNGEDAEVLETATGKVIGQGLRAIPTPEQARDWMNRPVPPALSEKRRIGEARIYLAFQTFQCPSECRIE